MRFWGEIDWVFNHMPALSWSCIGNISTEDRCLGAVDYLAQNKLLAQKLFFEIHDPQSADTEKILDKININRLKYEQIIGNLDDVKIHQLLEYVDDYIKPVETFVQTMGENVVIDISTLPKRFFFPIIKRILSYKEIKNILVAYTTPLSYAKEGLSDEADEPDYIPLFGIPSVDSAKPESAIVGVGFMPFGLPTLLQDKYKDAVVKFIFPFPPASPNFQRTWGFVYEIDKKYKIGDLDSIVRINSNNASAAYSFLKSESEGGNKTLLFAPYGPKPISLAMCLFACKYNCPVIYTQPHYYNPDYSEKIDKIYTYCIRLNGVDLYD